jgi:hypothetical protein
MWMVVIPIWIGLFSIVNQGVKYFNFVNRQQKGG